MARFAAVVDNVIKNGLLDPKHGYFESEPSDTIRDYLMRRDESDATCLCHSSAHHGEPSELAEVRLDAEAVFIPYAKVLARDHGCQNERWSDKFVYFKSGNGSEGTIAKDFAQSIDHIHHLADEACGDDRRNVIITAFNHHIKRALHPARRETSYHTDAMLVMLFEAQGCEDKLFTDLLKEHAKSVPEADGYSFCGDTALKRVTDRLCGREFEEHLLTEQTYLRWDVYCSQLLSSLKSHTTQETREQACRQMLESADRTRDVLSDRKPDPEFMEYVKASVEAWDWCLTGLGRHDMAAHANTRSE